MTTFTVPDIPQTLTLKHWQSTKDIPESLKKKSSCEDALAELAKSFKNARLESLAPFFKQTPAWAQYNHGRWSKLCNDLVREVIVNGVINLREALGEVRNAAIKTEKSIDKKDPLAPKSIAFLRKMAQAADAFLKELRPETIESAIRNKEKDVDKAMFEIAGAPLEDIKKLAAKAKAAAALVMRSPAPAVYNKCIGGGGDGLNRELAAALIALATLPSTKGIDYDGAAISSRTAKELLASPPLPATAGKDAVTNALKNFLQAVATASKLPKLKL